MKKHLLTALLLAAGFCNAQNVTLTSFATGFTRPLEIVHAGDSRLFVVEQAGRIKILNADGTTNATPFLNISSIISSTNERGLLGLAFAPNYADNGQFYVNYTNLSGNTVIARYRRSTDNPAVADPNSGSVILTINQPFSNHNGGCIHFGPDGYLYIAMGDGGSGDDPQGNGQNKNTLLGKMLRVNPEIDTPELGIPQDNPFVGVDGADEIWATGLRNPWKFSFDRTAGNIWIADVGQSALEEINRMPANQAGVNYGWRCYEGSQSHLTDGCSQTETYTMPFADYGRANGACSVTGGYVYRGTIYPELVGKYVFGDYCNSRIALLDDSANITWSSPFTGNFATFGEDNSGELYVAGITNGIVYKIAYGTPASTKNQSVTNIKLYPNPAKENLTVDTAGATLPLQARIFDLSGKLLQSTTIQQDQQRIDVSALSSGLYLTEISNANGISRQKIVID
nr:PQQ-dependent sugar dehydrogenase [uncultured Flavobacterium sp.]